MSVGGGERVVETPYESDSSDAEDKDQCDQPQRSHWQGVRPTGRDRGRRVGSSERNNPSSMKGSSTRIHGMHTLAIVALPGKFAVCRFPRETSLSSWDAAIPFLSITRTAEELSVVCPEESMSSWCDGRARLAVSASHGDARILAGRHSRGNGRARWPVAGIPLFAISTFDTDYLLVREANFDRAVNVLRAAGHDVVA